MNINDHEEQYNMRSARFEKVQDGRLYYRYERAQPWVPTDDYCAADAVSFATLPPAPPPATKASNPKDAIGDTKVPMWLLSVVAKAEWALALFAGMTKYGAWNYRKAGVRTSVYLSAMERHLLAYASGEERDPVDGSHHLGNIMACCSIILDAKEMGVLNDDRAPVIPFRDVFAKVEAQMAVLREQYKDKNPKHYTHAD